MILQYDYTCSTLIIHGTWEYHQVWQLAGIWVARGFNLSIGTGIFHFYTSIVPRHLFRLFVY